MVLKETNSIKNLAKKKKKDSIKRRETFAPFKSIFFEKKKAHPLISHLFMPYSILGPKFAGGVMDLHFRTCLTAM